MKLLLSYITPLVFYMALIFYLSSTPASGMPQGIDKGGSDLHVLEYTLLGFLAYRFFANIKSGKRRLIIILAAFAFSLLYGISDEIHQSFVPYRSSSLTDIAADSIGSLIGILLYNRIYLWKTGKLRALSKGSREE